MVTLEDGQPASKAVVKVSGHNKDIVTTSKGEWWRILTPGDFFFNAYFCFIGKYTVKAELGKQRSKEVNSLYPNNGLIKDQGELGGEERCDGAQG